MVGPSTIATVQPTTGNLYKEGMLGLQAAVAGSAGQQTAVGIGPGLFPANLVIERAISEPTGPVRKKLLAHTK